MCTVALALALALTAEPGFVSASPPTEYDAPAPDRAPSPPDASAGTPSDADATAGTVELVVDAPATPAATAAPAPDPAPAQQLPAPAPAQLAAPASPPAPGGAPVAGAAQVTASPALPANAVPQALPAEPAAADPQPPVAVIAPGQRSDVAPAGREGELPGVVLDASSRVDLVDARVVRAEAHVVFRVDAARKAPDGSSTSTSPRDAPLVQGLLDTVNRAFATVERVAAGALDPSGEPPPAKDEAPAAVAATPPVPAASAAHAAPPAPAAAAVQRQAEPSAETAVRPPSVTVTGTGAGAGAAGAPAVVSQTVNAAGQTVRTVRDPSGALIELVLDATGNVLSARIVNAVPAQM